MNCQCGANYIDGHTPGCIWVENIIADIRSGKAKIMAVKYAYNAARNILARGLARTAPAEVNVDHKVKRPLRSRRRKATV